MLSDKASAALLDIRDNIYCARSFVRDLSLESFTASRLHFYATTRALEIISEASRRLPESLYEKYPELPWRSIRNAGNMYRHAYDNIAEIFVWKTVQEDLGSLLKIVEAELGMQSETHDAS